MLDGSNQGVTPKELSGISAGSHTITLSKSGYNVDTGTVTVIAGQTTNYHKDLILIPTTTQPKLITDAPQDVTTTSVLLKGHLENGEAGVTYDVCFRYEGGRVEKIKVGFATVSTSNPGYEYLLTGLTPGTPYYYRAVTSASNGPSEPDPLDADEYQSFTTLGNSPPSSSIVASVDEDLLNYLDELIPSEGASDYFNDNWGISRDQYKIMIAALIWGEGGTAGYTAHSIYVDPAGRLGMGDALDHSDPDLYNKFWFSTGIGPLQIDRGGDSSDNWGYWPTIKKLDYRVALKSALTWHKKLNAGGISSLDQMRTNSRGTWYAYYKTTEGDNLGRWENTWAESTGLDWESVKNYNKGSILGITWEEAKNKLSYNAAKGVGDVKWEKYGEVVKSIGAYTWTINSGDAKTQSGKLVVLNNDFETYLITAKSLASGIEYSMQYYYANDDSQNIEIWAYYNPSDVSHHLKSIFVRDYSKKEFPYFPEGQNGKVAGVTLDHTAVSNSDKPTVDGFVPAAATVIKEGDAVSFNYQVSAPAGLKQVELWRTDIENVWPSDPTGYVKKEDVTGTSAEGPIDDRPPSTGTYWYGLHVVDVDGNWAGEEEPIRIIVEASDMNSDQPIFKAPWEGSARITQGTNGTTSHYDHGNWDNTYGLDIASMTAGEPFDVLAPYDGTVCYIDNDEAGAGGKEVAIKHTVDGNEYITVYLHLSEILVANGTSLEQGEHFAVTGMTGSATGVHLHFHMYKAPGSYDSHTQPIKRVILKKTGIDSDFIEYNMLNGELNETIIESYADRVFESNNVKIQSTQPKLQTDEATDITSTSAVLHGHLTNGEVGVIYPVCFRYEGESTQKTKTTATTVSVENPSYEFQLTGLEPETTYYYRAVHSESTGMEDPNPIDAASALSFTTPPGTSLVGSIQVNTVPSGAFVYLDNVYQGNSPVTLNNVVAGTHSVRVTKSGYQEQVRSVIVTADQTSNVSVSLPLVGPSGHYIFSTKWGSQGSGEGEFNYPAGIAINQSGYVYVAESTNNRTQVFDRTGTYITGWGSSGSGPGQFKWPSDIAVNSSGYLYITDAGNNRVQVFDPSGAYVSQWGSKGSGTGQLFSPRALSVNASDYVYVADYGNDRVQVFDPSGVYQSGWNAEYPLGIGTSDSGRVYVTESNNHRTRIFDPSGNLVSEWGSRGSGNGQFNFPTEVTVDKSGFVYVLDDNNARIQIFDPSGTYVTQWGSYGSEDWQLGSPQDIAVDQSGYIYVAELSCQIKVLAPTSIISPIAGFAANITTGNVPLTVQFTGGSIGSSTSWRWDFGDGATSTEPNPIHTYTTLGNYTVSLTVGNEAGNDTETKQGYITAITPPVQNTLSFSPATSEIVTGQTMELDVVLDTVPTGLAGFNISVALTEPSVGEIVAISYPYWTLMPVNSSLPADTVYAQAVDLMGSVGAGATNVTLCTLTVHGDASGETNLTITAMKVDDDVGGRYAPDTMDATLVVETEVPAPVADFTANTAAGPAPLTVRFTDTSTGDPTSWSWDFGDGVTSTEQNPVHTYTTPGTYTAILTVTNTVGSDSARQNITVTTTQVGSIAVTSAPAGAAIWLDDRNTGTFTNTTLTNIPAGDHVVRVELDGYQTMTKTVTVAAGEMAEVTFVLGSPAITLSPGWNFISVPKTLNATKNTAGSLFGNVDTGGKNILGYNSQTEMWTPVTAAEIISPLNGYWIYAAAGTDITLSYPSEPASTADKILYPGWNAVGYSADEQTTAETALACLNGSWKTVIPWNLAAGMYDPAIINGGTGTYSPERLMTFGNGYWIYVDSGSTLIGLTA
ncbi:MAG: PEGA domain-containing protein [Candidatus Cloacimonetes bacterium]|nr:PEGA domain-containing protein [Candidatus Cloacimonadota bacterium]